MVFGYQYWIYALTPEGELDWRSHVASSHYHSVVPGSDGIIYAGEHGSSSDQGSTSAFDISGAVLAVAPWSAQYRGPAVTSTGHAAVTGCDGIVRLISLWIRRASGTLELEDLAGPRPVVVEVEYRAPGGAALGSVFVALREAGTFVAEVPAEVFDLSVKPSHWLRKTVLNVDATTGDADGLALRLVNGDVNEDNRIDLVDLSLILLVFGTSGTNADLNHDGITDLVDLSIVLRNFGLLGDG